MTVLTGQWLRIDGTPAVGWVTAAYWRTLPAADTDQMWSTQPVEQRLTDEGRMRLEVPGTPQQVMFVELHVQLNHTRPESMVLVVPTNVETLDVADAERIPGNAAQPPAGGVEGWVSRTEVGAPGGVAPLDASGVVPARHLPPTGGDGGGGVYPPTVFGYGPPPADMTLLPGQIYLDQTSFLVYR